MHKETLEDIGEKELINRLGKFMPKNQASDDCALIKIKNDNNFIFDAINNINYETKFELSELLNPINFTTWLIVSLKDILYPLLLWQILLRFFYRFYRAIHQMEERMNLDLP